MFYRSPCSRSSICRAFWYSPALPLEPRCARGRGICPEYVGDHRRVSPVLLSSDVQDKPCLPVRHGVARNLIDPKWPALVGELASAPPQVFRCAARPALSRAARLLVFAFRLGFDGDHGAPNLSNVRDLVRYPELVFLDKHKWIPIAVYIGGCFAVAGWAGIVWGFSVSTVLLYHGTLFINSLGHVWGSRRYETGDQSRNNPWLAV